MAEVNVTNFGILTVSDRCSAGEAEDKSGDMLVDMVKRQLHGKGTVRIRACVPDERDQIKDILMEWSDKKKLDIILTTGGTGFGVRDITPEATRDIIAKEASWLSFAMAKHSLRITPLAMLSRAVCGIREQTLIINLPGSTKAAKECFECVIPALSHAVSLLRNNDVEITRLHADIRKMSDTSTLQESRHSRSEKSEVVEAEVHQAGSKVDVTLVARRPRESPYPLLSVDEAQAKVLEHSAVLGTETVNLKEALGRILSEDAFAQDPLPPFAASVKDGYAVLASDGAGPRKVVGDSIAGSEPGKVVVEPGTCVRINTGAPLPEGGDAVVQVEDTTLLEEGDEGKREIQIRIEKAPSVGLDIRPVGCDIEKDQKVLLKGSVLGPSELGLLATVGITKVPVFKQPTIAVLSTGNEVMDPDVPLTPGHIRDSNRTTLLAILEDARIPAVDLGIARDNPQSMLAKLQAALDVGDIVVTTGSVSMGDKDILKQVLLVDLEAEIHFGRVNMKPGKPVTFATCVYKNQKKLIFGLPGNPVSAMVTSFVFLVPSCRQMSGFQHPKCTVISAEIESRLRLDPRPEFHRAILSWSPEHDFPQAKSTGNQMSSRLLSVSAANALLMLPSKSDDLEFLEAGTKVEALVISRI